MTIRYYVVVRDSASDAEPGFYGPFSSVSAAIREAAKECDSNCGWIFTIFSLDEKGISKHICSAIIPDANVSWV
jgi:hypothetical protein